MHRPKKSPVLFCLCYLKSKPSPCVSTMSTHFMMNLINCFYGLCFNPLTSGVTEFSVTIIKHLLRRVEDELEFTSWTDNFCFSPVHLSSLRCLIKFSSRANICFDMILLCNTLKINKFYRSHIFSFWIVITIVLTCYV